MESLARTLAALPDNQIPTAGSHHSAGKVCAYRRSGLPSTPCVEFAQSSQTELHRLQSKSKDDSSCPTACRERIFPSAPSASAGDHRVAACEAAESTPLRAPAQKRIQSHLLWARRQSNTAAPRAYRLSPLPMSGFVRD